MAKARRKAVVRKKSVSTKKAKAAPKKKSESKYPSIKAALYALFASKGCENVSVAEATVLAKSVKKDTKFNRWHLYFHRKNWRQEQTAKSIAARRGKK